LGLFVAVHFTICFTVALLVGVVYILWPYLAMDDATPFLEQLGQIASHMAFNR